MTLPPTTRPADGPADNDIPRAPESAGAWDIRSEALLAEPAPRRPTGVRSQRLPIRRPETGARKGSSPDPADSVDKAEVVGLDEPWHGTTVAADSAASRETAFLPDSAFVPDSAASREASFLPDSATLPDTAFLSDSATSPDTA
ncbi:hypothetical protein, partial [Streptomyces sp. YS-3]|uniref:hypothetical protein n=1 Tax=Streptomyces sp. YS-3 TaxID=3381352 RepID=UPI0038629106